MKAEQGSGSIVEIRNRRTKEISHFKAFLPRELSKAPPHIKHPEKYQEPIEGTFEKREQAREILDAAIERRRAGHAVVSAIAISRYVTMELDRRRAAADRKYEDQPAKARKAVSKARSIDRLWLSKAPWYAIRPEAITADDLKVWFAKLADTGKNREGKKLSVSWLEAVKGLLVASFSLVPDLAVNPAEKIEIPTAKKKKPPFLKIDQCRQIFTCREIEIWDRVMLGCGMGAGLRIGELLAMEAQDVHLDDEDPHLYVQYGGDGHAPTKGTGEPRRVELCEPGLGFWRLWMRDYYAGGVRVFDGPSGGYMWHWAANFPRWAKFAGRERMTSHIMRHTYAVAMLSGSWGYDPKPMLLVSGQLGHASVQVTEDHYAAIEGGTAAREFRIATGRKAKKREPVTALSLLGHDVSPDVSHFSIEPKKAVGCDFVVDGRHLPLAQIAAENGSGLSDSDASTRQQDLTALARAVLDAVEARDGTGETRGVELAMALLAAGGVAIPGRAVG